MTDTHLRELERRFRASGTVEDEASWLRARMQAGELSTALLRLASYMGHQAAALVLGTASPDRPEEPKRWLRQLSVHWDQEACVRAVLAAIAMTPAHFRASAYIEETVAMAERWVIGPAEARCDVPELPARFSDRTVFQARETKLAWVAGIHIHRTLTRPAGWGIPAWTVAGSLQAHWPEAPVRDAIAREVAGWALRYSDPVRERVEARQRAAASE